MASCSEEIVLSQNKGGEDASSGCHAPSRKSRVLTHTKLAQLHPPPPFTEAALMCRNLL